MQSSIPRMVLLMLVLKLLAPGSLPVGVGAKECGTRFTDFTSSALLAEVVLQGSVKEFNPPSSASQLRSANISAADVYKGMSVLKSNGRINNDMVVEIESFGQENKDECVASDDETMKGKDMIFFLRQSPNRRVMELSALPLPAQGNEKRRVKRSLCETCIRPPVIKRLVCKDCAKEPTIKKLKSRKVTMGRRARLRCNARGKPKPEITWFKNQVPVMSGNGGITIRSSSLSSTLLFTRTTSAHSGRYTCVATNDIGRAEGVVTLEVSRKPPRRKTHTQSNNQSVKDAADKVLCEANPCLNGGTCYFSPSLNLRRCICAAGFEGVTCENVLSPGTIQDNDVEDDAADTREVESPPATPSARSLNMTEKVLDTTSSPLSIGDRNNQSSMSKTVPTPPSSITISNVRTTTTSTTTTTTTELPIANTPDDNSVQPVEPPTSNQIIPNVHRTHSSSNSIFSRSKTKSKSRYTSNGERVYPVKRKSSLKIVPCADKSYCLNNGKCRYISKLKRKFCQCRKGYVGARCERSLF